jgi:outer membrane receptor protein involved in Fe transport
MSLGSLVAYTAKYEETILGVVTDYAGTQVETKFGLIPNIRANGFMTWSKDIYSIEYAIRYIGPAEEENYGGTMWDVDAVMYHDIRASFDFDPLTLTFGVNNLFNTEPPFVDTAFNGNTSIENYDVMGSFGYLRLTLKF